MHPIRFRVWNREKKEMQEIDDYYNLLMEEKGRWFCLINRSELYCNFLFGDLMQYTGLKDMDGNRIYEGDIVKGIDCCGNDLVAEVQYKDQQFYPLSVDVGCGDDSMTLIKIIGNIYQNPDLIKEYSL